MIPTTAEIHHLWDRYQLSKIKRQHSELVARLALFLAEKLRLKNSSLKINLPLLAAAALLHDFDKNAPKLPSERHPDTGVRILRESGFPEVAQLVKIHPLHAILDPELSPKSWEEKLLFLADKMVKNEIITVDKRFALWRAENLSLPERQILETSYPKVKSLEQEIFSLIRLDPSQIAKFVTG